METLRHILVLAHLVGFALLFGAWAVEAVGRRLQVTRVMHAGLAVSAITGIVLAAPWGLSDELNYVKISVKLLVLLAIGALLGIGQARQRRNGEMPSAIFWSIGILTVANAGVAVLWR